MTFINRTDELNAFNTLWEMNTAQLVILYGKRRVGKTELIKQFISDKPSLYYLADKRTPSDQLREFGKRVGLFFDDPTLQHYGFRDWLEAFAYLARQPHQPFVLAIDEYPYLTESDPATGSLFQKGWDTLLKDSQIFLILCGSSIAMMEHETLTYTAPLYGRRTADFLIQPMPYKESWEFFPSHAFKSFVEFYTVSGGSPAYLTAFSSYSDRNKAIDALVLNRYGLLHREVEFLLKEETREPKTYLSILSAISLGKHKFGEIANETGLDKHGLTKYLSTLMQLKFITRDVPITESHPEKSKKSLYVLADFFSKFWFHAVFPHKSELEIGQKQGVLTLLKDSLVHLESATYEAICRDWLRRNKLDGAIPEKVGRWWDGVHEIDAIGLHTTQNHITFAEVKWSKKNVGVDVLDALIAKSARVQWDRPNRRETFVLFSLNGFTTALLNRVKQEQKLSIALVKEDHVCLRSQAPEQT